MKTLLAAAISVVLCTACSSSDDDASDAAGMPEANTPATSDDGDAPAGGTATSGTGTATGAGDTTTDGGTATTGAADAGTDTTGAADAADAGTDTTGAADAGTDTTGAADAGTDTTGAADAGTDTTGATDAGTDTTGATDAGTDTTGAADAGTDTTGETDAGTDTTGETDAGTDTTGDDDGTIDDGTDTNGGADSGELDAAYNNVLVALAGYQSEAADQRVRALAAQAIDSALDTREQPDGSTTIEGRDGNPVTVPTTLTQYDCASGGVMTIELSEGRIADEGFSRAVDLDRADFAECRLDDQTTINGGVVASLESTSGSGGSMQRRSRTWSDFQLSAPDGGLQIDGSTVFARTETNENDESRTVDLSRFVETGGDGAVQSTISDANMTLSRSTRAGNALEDYSLTVSGTVQNASTGGEAVTVSTVTPLDRSFAFNPGFEAEARPFSGELQMRTDSGSNLTIIPRETGAPELAVDLTFTGSDGTSRTSENVPFANLPTRAESDTDQ